LSETLADGGTLSFNLRYNCANWQNNTDIHKRIAQDIDDLFYGYEQKGFKVDFDTIDRIIENVKTVALRRFR
jgi:type I restriction enzyme R subunit